jgi:transcriptional regulator with XRE-family HTH domain
MFLDGRHLRAARVAAGLSQAALADLAGVHRGSVRYWERHTTARGIDGWALREIEKALLGAGVRAEVAADRARRFAVVRFEQKCTSRSF